MRPKFRTFKLILDFLLRFVNLTFLFLDSIFLVQYLCLAQPKHSLIQILFWFWIVHVSKIDISVEAGDLNTVANVNPNLENNFSAVQLRKRWKPEF